MADNDVFDGDYGVSSEATGLPMDFGGAIENASVQIVNDPETIAPTNTDPLVLNIEDYFDYTQMVTYNQENINGAVVVGYLRIAECIICKAIVRRKNDSLYGHMRRHYIAQLKGLEPNG